MEHHVLLVIEGAIVKERYLNTFLINKKLFNQLKLSEYLRKVWTVRNLHNVLRLYSQQVFFFVIYKLDQ
jgi:hypothetical protein